MNSRPFKQPPPRPAKQIGGEYRIRPRGIASASPREWFTARMPKTVTVEHEGYRRLVAALPCIRCLQFGRSQAAHPNTGKGASMKTDDRLVFPLCTDRPGYVGCHTLFDQHALYSKAMRRELEPEWGRLTREQIRSTGQWPTNLPEWAADKEIA